MLGMLFLKVKTRFWGRWSIFYEGRPSVW